MLIDLFGSLSQYCDRLLKIYFKFPKFVFLNSTAMLVNNNIATENSNAGVINGENISEKLIDEKCKQILMQINS